MKLNYLIMMQRRNLDFKSFFKGKKEKLKITKLENIIKKK